MGRRSSTPITSTPRRSALFLATTHSRRSKRRRRACATRCGGSPGPSDLIWHLRGYPSLVIFSKILQMYLLMRLSFWK